MNYRRSFFITTCIAFGFAFLYIPILSMVVFSFNASKLVTVWDSANSPTLEVVLLAACTTTRSSMRRGFR